MKKLVILLISLILFYTQTFASSDYQNDYTLIDCENGSDSTGIPFDSSKPYKTLNDGIEKTINYINTYVNTGSLTYQSGLVFNIKVNCSIVGIGVNSVYLNFDGKTYNDYLNIEGIGENSLLISDLIFDIPNGRGGGITFKNAKFLSNSRGYYFYYIPPSSTSYNNVNYYMNYGVKIEDSYIKLSPNTEFGYSTITSYYHYRTYYIYHFNPFQYIQNSTIDIEVNGNYTFYTPLIVKDSKINFQNLYATGTYDINFINKGGNYAGYDFNFFTLMSNEIDMGGNNFMTENTKNVSFINNKFSNFNNFYLGTNDASLKYGIFVNNLFENVNPIDISKNRNIINNVFSGDYTDTYDIRNLRKNYKLDNLGTKGIGWVFQKLNASDMFRLNYSSTSLYKEITGQDIPSIANTIYAIFSR